MSEKIINKDGLYEYGPVISTGPFTDEEKKEIDEAIQILAEKISLEIDSEIIKEIVEKNNFKKEPPNA